jgi:Tol biopolymer transport system component
MSNKRQNPFVLMSIILVSFLSSCSECLSGNSTLTTQPFSTDDQTPTIFLKSETPTRIFTPSFPMNNITSYPQKGELFFMRNFSINELNFLSKTVTEIINSDTPTNNLSSVSTGYLYYQKEDISYQSQIYRVKLDGSGLERLTYDDYYDNNLAISRDGSRLAFVQEAFPSGDTERISVIDYRNGGLEREVFSGNRKIESLSWSNNGEKLAFILWNGDIRLDNEPIYGDLYIMDANGANLTQLNLGLSIVYDFPAWSPDDSQLAISAHDDKGINLYTIDVISQAIRKLTNSINGVRNPIWSPNGDRILFMDGSNYCTTTQDGTDQKVFADQAPDPKFSYRVATWSPDGRFVALVRNFALYIVDADGGSPLLIFDPLKPGDTISNLSWITPIQP